MSRLGKALTLVWSEGFGPVIHRAESHWSSFFLSQVFLGSQTQL